MARARYDKPREGASKGKCICIYRVVMSRWILLNYKLLSSGFSGGKGSV